MMAGGVPLDPDAQAFLTAAGITDATITAAIDTLVLDLKGYGLWTKMKAIYPFVGGTATTHKYNLKDPQDTNAAFRLVFAGGWTHSANGAQPNGTNAYADTFLIPSIVLSQNNTHLSYYSRTNSLTNSAEIGFVAAGNDRLLMNIYFSGSYNSDQYNLLTGRVSTPNTNTIGFYNANRTSASSHKAYKNGNQVGSTNTGSSGSILIINGKIYLSADNNTSGIASNFSNKQCAFSSIGDGLTDTEAANYYTAVQLFQTTLGRQV